MAQFYDAVVIGGGPAGSTVATALTRAGRSVIVFEKEKFPRFHVGESLLPFCLPIFEKLGLSEKIRTAGFQEKYGAFFWNETTGGTRPVVFENSWDDRHPMAYQVKRADFDQLLLRHSEDSGAVVREETAIHEILFEAGRAVGVVARGRAAGNEEVRAKVVVDASGQTAFLSQKLGTRRFETKLKRAAVFAHYEGVPRPAGRQAGDILLPTGEDVWYWIIPFSDGTASVGAVFEPAVTRGDEAETLEQRFDRLIARNSRMPELLAGGRRISKVFGISDYSAASAKLRGDGYILVGDAAMFLDPVFSTGVFLAMATGMRAAAAIDRALTRHSRVDAEDLKTYEREANRLFARFRRFVHAFYDPVFFEAFCTEAPNQSMRAAVTSVLAGGVEKIPLRAQIWMNLMFLGIGFDRWRRRLLRLPPNRLRAGSREPT